MCDAPLDAATLRSGAVQCPACEQPFESTVFRPRELRHEAVQEVTQTPDGVATACANHAGNAAVTTCQRCGLFICALCDMNTGEGSYCPSCFERIRTGNVQTGIRYRDYASMAVSAAVLALFCWIPLGPFVIYWAWKGIRQRREEGSGIAGMVVTLIVGILETLAVVGGIILMIIGMVVGS
jgi:uncharacterized paraquat-inducible protein A